LAAFLVGYPVRSDDLSVRKPGEAPPTADADAAGPDAERVIPATQQAQPQPLPPAPRPIVSEPATPTAAEQLAASVFRGGQIDRSLLSATRQASARSLTADVVLGGESRFRATTDAGNLLGRSTSARGLVAKERAPVITDPRIRGSNVGQLIASGSYWFPARQDLDTLLSKIDSRAISDVIVIKGPYAARYGPGFQFVDVELLRSPRFEDGYEQHMQSSLEYKTNGEQWYGRETLWGGAADWGYRIGYGHRTGSDYEAGNDDEFIASYKSRDLDVAIGVDLSENARLEFSYLRLDQTDVEVVTQLLDIDFLVTDAFELNYMLTNQAHFDTLRFETWYNRTRLEGDSNSTGKREQIPFVGANIRSIFSDANNMSTGYSLSIGWGAPDDCQLMVGVDFRYLGQEVNNLADVIFLSFPGLFGNNATPELNGPLPEAHSINPGLFIEETHHLSDQLTVNIGGRFDWVSTNARQRVKEVDGLAGPLGLFGPNGEFPYVYNPSAQPITLPDGMGGLITVPGVRTDLSDLLLGEFDQEFQLGAAYITGEYQCNDCWTLHGGFGFAMRPPTMSELYPLQLISTVLPQQTFSILFGNPNLDPEKRYQVDAGLSGRQGRWRGSIGGFYALIQDYITFDALLPTFYVYQTANTDLASLAGFDLAGEYEINCWLTGFATMNYVEGRDLDRTSNALPSFFDPPGSELRSGLVGRDHEPLPNIPPLESRVGVRVHDPGDDPRWGLELSARIVDHQDRFATSLQEMSTPGFTTWDLRSFWRLTQRATLVAGVENFTDKFYLEHLDPHGRVVASSPLVPGSPESSLGTVFRPGVNFYFAVEVTW
jgi:outer membrane receptor protein involved in Fe transport